MQRGEWYIWSVSGIIGVFFFYSMGCSVSECFRTHQVHFSLLTLLKVWISRTTTKNSECFDLIFLFLFHSFIKQTFIDYLLWCLVPTGRDTRKTDKRQSLLGGKAETKTVLIESVKRFWKKAQNVWDIEEGKLSSENVGTHAAIWEILTDMS